MITEVPKHLMPATEVDTTPAPDIITEVPEELRVPEATQVELGHIALITHAPGVESSGDYIDPNDAAAAIQEQLDNLPAGSPRPEIRAGGVDGIITQRGGQ